MNITQMFFGYFELIALIVILINIPTTLIYLLNNKKEKLFLFYTRRLIFISIYTLFFIILQLIWLKDYEDSIPTTLDIAWSILECGSIYLAYDKISQIRFEMEHLKMLNSLLKKFEKEITKLRSVK